jgi:prenylcysteine oxidase / farnesylcysteine lyase
MKFSSLISFLFPPCALALQSHQHPHSQTPLLAESALHVPVHRVAIVGAGAAGSSAAYHLSQYAAESEHAVEITIFDLNARAGGRSTTVNALHDPEFPVELGASIFVKINRILYTAAEEFGLQTSSASALRSGESAYSLGVWDGEAFVFKQTAGSGRWSGYWDVVKLLWKYGAAPIRVQRMAKSTVDRFLKMYDAPVFPWRRLSDTVAELGLVEYTSTTGQAVLDGGDAGGAFVREVVQASTRVNYAQNLGQIHGLEGLVCMAIEGAVAVQGGNWRIFDEMVRRSGADARFGSVVTGVEVNDDGTYTVNSKSAKLPSLGMDGHFDTTEDTGIVVQKDIFDTLILATPMDFSNITFTPPLANPPNSVDYVTLHVTLFTSPHRLSAVYFGLADQKDVPDMVITTLPDGLDLGNLRGIDAVGPAGFWSVSALRRIQRDGERVQYLYKIFSPAPVTGSWLSSLLGFRYENSTESDPMCDVPTRDVTWSYQKVWHSYPYAVPRTEFEELEFTWGDMGKVWYTSGIEGFISTMETSAISGKNVARLVAHELETERWLSGLERMLEAEDEYS